MKNYSKRELYAAGEPLGDSVTRKNGGKVIFGSGGGGGGGQSTTTQSIPDELKPLASAYASKAINLANQGYTPYAGQRFADMNNAESSAVNMIANRAMNGSAELNAGSRNLTDTLNGMYLGQSNPYLQSQIDQGSQGLMRNYYDAMKNTDAAAAKSGVYGGSSWEQMASDNSRNLATGLSNLESGMRYNNYSDERGRQLQATGMSPTYANQPYQDAQQLMTAGQFLQDQKQQSLDGGYQQYQDSQNLPYKQLAAMSGVFGSNLGSTATTTQSGGGK